MEIPVFLVAEVGRAQYHVGAAKLFNTTYIITGFREKMHTPQKWAPFRLALSHGKVVSINLTASAFCPCHPPSPIFSEMQLWVMVLEGKQQNTELTCAEWQHQQGGCGQGMGEAPVQPSPFQLSQAKRSAAELQGSGSSL